MWQTDTQAAETIARMLKVLHRDELWDADGPTRAACDYLEAGGGPLSHGEQVLLRVAFDLWNGKGKATIDDLVNVLDDRCLQAVLRAVLVVRPGGRPAVG